jgi:hypothetical protein
LEKEERFCEQLDCLMDWEFLLDQRGLRRGCMVGVDNEVERTEMALKKNKEEERHPAIPALVKAQ